MGDLACMQALAYIRTLMVKMSAFWSFETSQKIPLYKIKSGVVNCTLYIYKIWNKEHTFYLDAALWVTLYRLY